MTDLQQSVKTKRCHTVEDWRESNLLIENDPPFLEEQGLLPWLNEVEEYARPIYKKCCGKVKERSRTFDEKTQVLRLVTPANTLISSKLLHHVQFAKKCLDDPEKISRHVSKITQLLLSPYSQTHALARSRPNCSARHDEIRRLRQQGEKVAVLARIFGLSLRQISRICKT